METYSVLIVGGGASGIDLAVMLLQAGIKDFCLVERTDRIGKKLIATGNGQGNLTNVAVSPDKYFSKVKGFASYAVNTYGFNSVKNFYSSLGIKLVEGEEGKYYPESKQASSALDIIRAYLEYNGADIRTNFNVVSLKKKDGLFVAASDSGNKIAAKNVVVAVGGSAGKQFGTDGSSYKLVTSLGHRLVETYPSLVQLKTETGKIKSLKGIKADVNVTAVSDGKFLKTESGELLFTDYGVSGNAIFKISAFLAGKPSPELVIEFMPELDAKSLTDIIEDRKSTKPYIKSEDLFIGLVNKMLGRVLVKTARSNATADLVSNAKRFRLKVTGDLGFNYAQVTRGGISVKDFFDTTFESKIAKGLYVIGEALDVDGECGGYNLHFAYASAACCAKSLIETLGGSL